MTVRHVRTCKLDLRDENLQVRPLRRQDRLWSTRFQKQRIELMRLPDNTSDEMASAVMEAITRLRNDPRIDQLPAGQTARVTLVEEHLKVVADYWHVEHKKLALMLARVLDHAPA